MSSINLLNKECLILAMKFSDDPFKIHELQNVLASTRIILSGNKELLTVSQIIAKKCLSKKKKNEAFGFKTVAFKTFF